MTTGIVEDMLCSADAIGELRTVKVTIKSTGQVRGFDGVVSGGEESVYLAQGMVAPGEDGRTEAGERGTREMGSSTYYLEKSDDFELTPQDVAKGRVYLDDEMLAQHLVDWVSVYEIYATLPDVSR